MSARPTHPTQLGFGVPAHGIRTRNSTPTDKAPPFTLMAGSSFRDGGTPSPTPSEDYTPRCRFASLRAKRGNPFMTYLCKICFKKPSISFPATYPTAHDRFLCIDDTVYHIGASLKDLGKKWFAFSRMEIGAEALREKM